MRSALARLHVFKADAEVHVAVRQLQVAVEAAVRPYAGARVHRVHLAMQAQLGSVEVEQALAVRQRLL